MGHVSLRHARLDAGARTLLADVNLDALPGEFLAVVGPNGVGKTTLLRTIAGSHRAASGTVLVDGVQLASLRPRDRARHVAMLTSGATAPAGMTVEELVATGRFAQRPWWIWNDGEADARAAREALACVGLTELAPRHCETLSSGELQRAWLALALAQGARTILLDEPTSHLDVRFALEILALLRDIASGGTTVIAVLHDIDEAADFADRVALLGEQSLLTVGAPREALAPAALERAYGIAFEAIDAGGLHRVVPSAQRRSPRPP